MCLLLFLRCCLPVGLFVHIRVAIDCVAILCCFVVCLLVGLLWTCFFQRIGCRIC
jgi:hypothetical protein